MTYEDPTVSAARRGEEDPVSDPLLELGEVKADCRRWRHEYRIEKQKNTLLLSDRKQMREAIGEFLIDWDREHFTDEVGPDLFDAVEELRRLIG